MPTLLERAGARTPKPVDYYRIEVEQIALTIARRFGDTPQRAEEIYRTAVGLWDRFRAANVAAGFEEPR